MQVLVELLEVAGAAVMLAGGAQVPMVLLEVAGVEDSSHHGRAVRAHLILGHGALLHEVGYAAASHDGCHPCRQ